MDRLAFCDLALYGRFCTGLIAYLPSWAVSDSEVVVESEEESEEDELRLSAFFFFFFFTSGAL